MNQKHNGLNTLEEGQPKDTTKEGFNLNDPGEILGEVMAESNQWQEEQSSKPEDINPVTAIEKTKPKVIKRNPFAIIRKYIAEEMPTIMRNKVTGEIELDGVPLTEQDLNSQYINLTTSTGETIKLNEWQTFINSNHLPSYHPLERYLKHQKQLGNGFINKLINSLELDQDGLRKDLVSIVIRKWLIGLVAGLFHDNYNALVPVLIGAKGTGKTEFWRRLLPKELQNYFAETKLDAGKDDESKACENLVLLIDEMDFLTKREASEIRRFISQNYFTYRPPYGRKNIKRKRMASMCGASNEVQVINDHRNNRRIIPIMIKGINHDEYNAIDKDGLLMEAYALFRAGNAWDLSPDEIRQLERGTGNNVISIAEEELLTKYFQPGDGFYTASEIAAEIIRLSGLKLSPVKIGKSLTGHGFERGQKRINGKPIYGWMASPCYTG